MIFVHCWRQNEPFVIAVAWYSIVFFQPRSVEVSESYAPARSSWPLQGMVFI